MCLRLAWVGGGVAIQVADGSAIVCGLRGKAVHMFVPCKDLFDESQKSRGY